jgi:hypothetical protein
VDSKYVAVCWEIAGPTSCVDVVYEHSRVVYTESERAVTEMTRPYVVAAVEVDDDIGWIDDVQGSNEYLAVRTSRGSTGCIILLVGSSNSE